MASRNRFDTVEDVWEEIFQDKLSDLNDDFSLSEVDKESLGEEDIVTNDKNRS